MSDTKRVHIMDDDGALRVLLAVARRARLDLEAAAKSGNVAQLPAVKRRQLVEAGEILLDLAQGVKSNG